MQLDPEVERMEEHRGVLLDLDGYHMEYAIFIHLLSLAISY